MASHCQDKEVPRSVPGFGFPDGRLGRDHRSVRSGPGGTEWGRSGASRLRIQKFLRRHANISRGSPPGPLGDGPKGWPAATPRSGARGGPRPRHSSAAHRPAGQSDGFASRTMRPSSARARWWGRRDFGAEHRDPIGQGTRPDGCLINATRSGDWGGRRSIQASQGAILPVHCEHPWITLTPGCRPP
jgi:hypothetical protein